MRPPRPVFGTNCLLGKDEKISLNQPFISEPFFNLRKYSAENKIKEREQKIYRSASLIWPFIKFYNILKKLIWFLIFERFDLKKLFSTLLKQMNSFNRYSTFVFYRTELCF